MPDRAPTPIPALAHPGASFLTNTQPVTLPDGRVLQTYTAGSGGDVIVLESGMGAGAAYWGLVVDELVSHPVRVVGYDRAGYGGSTPANDTRRVQDLANDLVHLLSTLDMDRLVLVGHSWGGPILRVATAQLPPDIKRKLAGLLLVDPSDELCRFYYSYTTIWFFWASSYLIYAAYYLGLMPRIGRAVLDPLPEPYMSAALAASLPHAQAWEVMDITTNLRTSGGDEIGQARRDELCAAHRRRVQIVKGRYILAEKSSHNVNIDEPGLVAREAMTLLGNEWRAD
ncbi:hypothetical protein CcaverHIS631_0402760 [Cutaneotrichosporon cavernicola]|nr:hypothetical protein CcaverHIS631_0402760 [Cutaneotrichosporon cavernicola]